MLRELSAIGLSRYTGQRAAGKLVSDALASAHIRGAFYQLNDRQMVEAFYEMGPFQLVLRGVRSSEANISITSVMPALKEKRGYYLGAPEVFVGKSGDLYLEGTEQETLETMTLCLTDIARYYKDKASYEQSFVMASCYGLSTEGKILLGIERTEEDLRLIKEEMQERRRMLKMAWDGDVDIRQELREDEIDSEGEVLERLKDEDVYSIFDGFYYPAERDENCFTVLGDIKEIDKLMNPLTEEWSYYLELDVLGQMQRVLINPRDLVGEPAIGRRFQGKVRFYGRLDPARLILEDRSKFF